MRTSVMRKYHAQLHKTRIDKSRLNLSIGLAEQI